MTKKFSYTQLKIIIIIGIVLFFGIIFLYYLNKIGTFSEDKEKNIIRNNRVIFEQPKLSIFDESRYINQFPDTIHMHYPNFIVVIPEDTKQITTVYSIPQKKVIASFNDIALDYANGNFLYNYHGGDTYFRNKKLGVHCILGFIKSNTEILCVIQDPHNPLQNKLISINPQSDSTNDIYDPLDAITAVYDNAGMLYVGEYDYNKNQAYLTINNKKVKTNTFISIIYPMNGVFYTASFKNSRNNISDAYYEIIEDNKNVALKLAEKGEIVFYNVR